MASHQMILGVTMVILMSMTASSAYTISLPAAEDFEPMTCYTCQDKGDNEDCNSWAPEVYCHTNHTVCKTVHRFSINSGESVRVDKTCAQPEHCSMDTVGCQETDDDDVMECTSCCTDSYCNKPVPYSLPTALSQSVTLFSGAEQSRVGLWPIVTATAITWYISGRS